MGIHSSKVMLIEGDADEFVPGVEQATGMHGFAVMVPPGEGGDRLLDMVWRIATAYAGMPGLLENRASVRTMVRAVMSWKHRPDEIANPARSRDSGIARAPASELLAGLHPAPELRDWHPDFGSAVEDAARSMNHNEYLKDFFAELERLRPLEPTDRTHALTWDKEGICVLLSLGDARASFRFDKMDTDPISMAGAVIERWRSTPPIELLMVE